MWEVGSGICTVSEHKLLRWNGRVMGGMAGEIQQWAGTPRGVPSPASSVGGGLEKNRRNDTRARARGLAAQLQRRQMWVVPLGMEAARRRARATRSADLSSNGAGYFGHFDLAATLGGRSAMRSVAQPPRACVRLAAGEICCGSGREVGRKLQVCYPCSVALVIWFALDRDFVMLLITVS